MGNKAPISLKGHQFLLDYVLQEWSKNRGFYYSEFLPKLWNLDYAYYTVRKKRAKAGSNVDVDFAGCTTELQRDLLTLPIAIADADTAVSDLAETFLTGNPIFGVVAAPEQRQVIDYWEALFQYHGKLGHWRTELYKCFSSAVRYNMPVLDVDWKLSYEFASEESYTTVKDKAQISPVPVGTLAFYSPDPYNMIWDLNVHPSDLASRGAYAGYSEIVTRTELKSMFTAYSLDENRSKFTFNLREAFDTAFPANYYNWKPPVSKFIVADKESTNWVEWAFDHRGVAQESGRSVRYNNTDDFYLLTKMYMKLIPSDYGIRTSHENTPRIYKMYIINRQYIVYLEPIYTPGNNLPMMLGDMTDDYFDYQAQSEVEKMLPYQDLSSELLQVRMQSAQRALGDRAIYDPLFFNQGDINTSEAAAKIPLSQSLGISQKAIAQVYQQIPFDHMATAGVMGDVQALIQMSRLQSGRNEFMQGQNRKGNRTLGEFQEVQAAANVRQIRLPLRIEGQIINPTQALIKSLFKQNVTEVDLMNTKTRQLMTVDPVALQDSVVDFKLASGFLNKGMSVNPELLMGGMQMMQQDPELSMSYNKAEWFAYIMSMGGVPDVDQFRVQPAQPGVVPGGSGVPTAPGTTPEGEGQ